MDVIQQGFAGQGELLELVLKSVRNDFGKEREKKLSHSCMDSNDTWNCLSQDVKTRWIGFNKDLKAMWN